jgi:hypothetical protein
MLTSELSDSSIPVTDAAFDHAAARRADEHTQCADEQKPLTLTPRCRRDLS